MFKRFGLIRVLARGRALALLLFANAASAEDKESGASTVAALVLVPARRSNFL